MYNHPYAKTFPEKDTFLILPKYLNANKSRYAAKYKHKSQWNQFPSDLCLMNDFDT